MNGPKTGLQGLEQSQGRSKAQIVLNAIDSNKIKHVGDDQLTKAVVNLLRVANNRSSTKANNDTLDQAAIDLFQELKTNYRGLGINEVKLAIDYGSLGRFGEFYGVNSKSVIGWLEEYKNTLRIEGMKEKRKLKDIDEAKQIKEAQVSKEREFHNQVFNYYSTGKLGHNSAFAVYRYLADTLGHDYLSGEEKWDIFEKAKKQRAKEFESEMTEAMKKNDRNSVKQLKLLIQDPPDNYVKSKAEEMALPILVNRMKEKNIKLEKHG